MDMTLEKENAELKERLKKVRNDLSNAEYELERSVSSAQYLALQKSHNDTVEESAKMSKELTALRKKLASAEKVCEEKAAQIREADGDISLLTRYNELMETELKRLREKYDYAIKAVDIARREVLRLRSRNLFARILNL